ncbi:STAS domain-containing protein [Streptomyces sp. NPDC056683]|uniref:STAS domain-containing protein n=1 Tax=Streptomyces sp. NPDC056683 TaxID=3345910 RepID=UPI003680FABB
MLEPFRVAVQDRRDHCVVTVVGELDVVTAAELRHVLQQAVATYPRTVVDLAGVSFCDCTGLSALLAASRHAQERGAVLRLRSVPHALARILRLTHTRDAFTSETRDSSAPIRR